MVEGGKTRKPTDVCRELIAENNLSGIFACSARTTYFMCNILKDVPQGGKLLFVGTGVFNELKPHFETGLIHASVYQATREQGERAVTVIYDYLSGKNDFLKKELLPVVLVFRENARFFSVLIVWCVCVCVCSANLIKLLQLINK